MATLQDQLAVTKNSAAFSIISSQSDVASCHKTSTQPHPQPEPHAPPARPCVQVCGRGCAEWNCGGVVLPWRGCGKVLEVIFSCTLTHMLVYVKVRKHPCLLFVVLFACCLLLSEQVRFNRERTQRQATEAGNSSEREGKREGGSACDYTR